MNKNFIDNAIESNQLLFSKDEESLINVVNKYCNRHYLLKQSQYSFRKMEIEEIDYFLSQGCVTPKIDGVSCDNMYLFWWKDPTEEGYHVRFGATP